MDVEMADDDFSSATQSFLAWLQQNGTTISDKIELADLRSQSAGRGVVAKSDLNEDEVLFSIPRSAILDTNTTALPRPIALSLEDPWLSLILAMLFEHQQGSASKWKPYFDVLPTEFDTLMFWSESDLEALQGSAVANKIGQESADKTFEETILPIVTTHPDVFQIKGLSNADILALCHRMGSTIMAYAFDLEKASSAAAKNANKIEEDGWEEDSTDEEEALLPKGMVPLADMLNANADLNNAKLFYEDDAVVMKTINPIAAGEEVYNDYGPLPRADVLRRYGYVTEEYAGYDVVEISTELVTKTLKEVARVSEKEVEDRLAYLDDQGVLDSGYDIARVSSEDGPFPEEFCVLLNTLTAAKADYDKMKKKENLPKPKFPPASLELLYETLLRRRAEYTPTAVQEDRAALGAGQGSRRQMMGLQVIIGEKEVLQSAAEEVQKMLAAAPGNKKRKTDSFEEEAIGAAKKQRN